VEENQRSKMKRADFEGVSWVWFFFLFFFMLKEDDELPTI